MTDISTSTTLNMDFWGVLSTLEAQIPFTQQKIEHILGISLKDVSSTQTPKFYGATTGPVALKDGTSITGIGFSVRRDGSRPGDVGVSINSPCISLKDVQKHYKNIKTPVLYGTGTIQAKEFYSDFRRWGKLSFVFPYDDKNPDSACLTAVGFQVSYMSETIYMIESSIRDVKQRIEQGKWVDANIDAMNGLSWADSSSPYASPDVLTKSKKQLELANQSGQLEKAVPLRLEVLQMRLADFKARYPKPNPR